MDIQYRKVGYVCDQYFINQLLKLGLRVEKAHDTYYVMLNSDVPTPVGRLEFKAFCEPFLEIVQETIILNFDAYEFSEITGILKEWERSRTF